jgi:hypothetical protein
MPSTLLSQFIAFPASVVLGGWLALISYSSPGQAKIIPANFLMNQAVAEPLAAPLQTSGTLYAQQSLPQLQSSSPINVIEFQKQSQSSYQVAPSYQNNYQDYNSHQYYNRYYSPPSNHFGRYFVYVNGNSWSLLQQVRQIEPSAYIRQFQGRSVIQAGAFSKEYNALQRVRQLESYGIYRTQLISSANGEGNYYSPYSYSSYREGAYRDGNFYSPYSRPYYPYRQRSSYSAYGDNYPRYKGKFYYVVIPANSEDLPEIESRLQQRAGLQTNLMTRNHPRGPHVAVGPFSRRLEAEQWNNYLRSLGFANARVYYGS